MRQSITKFAIIAAVAALPVIGVTSFTSSDAKAQGFNIEVGPNGIRTAPGYDRYERDDRRGGCSERQARAAARDEGLRGAEVIRVTRRTITVEGMTRRGPERMRFANEPGCPTIG